MAAIVEGRQLKKVQMIKVSESKKRNSGIAGIFENAIDARRKYFESDEDDDDDNDSDDDSFDWDDYYGQP